MITRRQRPLPHPALVVRLYVHLKGLFFFFSKLVIKTTHKHTHTQPSLPYHLSLHEHITQLSDTSRQLLPGENVTLFTNHLTERLLFYIQLEILSWKKSHCQNTGTHTHSHSHRYTHEYTNNGLRNEEKKACSRIHCILYITYTKMQDRQ